MIGLVSGRVLVVCALLSGCDPTWQVEGTVVDGNGRAIPDATVTLAWPADLQSPDERVQTDATGRFEFGGVARARESHRCMLRVEKSGFAKKALSVLEVCQRSTARGNAEEPCDPARSRVVLR